jgi:hypothetical protein
MKERILSLILLVGMLLCSIFLVVRPVSSSSTLSPWATLCGAGALWAANGGTRAAYVDQYDNLVAYPNPYMSADSYLPLKNEIVSILEGDGFTVDTFATIPANLSQYNLVYLEAYFACEPADEPAIRNYISSGGGFVAEDGSMNYLVYNSQTLDTGSNLSSIADWFGASVYINTGGDAYVSVQNPLGTSLTSGEQLITGSGYSNAGLQSMSASSQVLATWSDGSTFAFTNTYGQGRVYWQVNMFPTTQQSSGSGGTLSLTLFGGFDYGIAEPAKVKVFAELRDPITMGPISGANVTIQVFDPNDTLWVSAGMTETLNGTGIYEWDSPDTLANMNLQPGVYLAYVTASNGSSSASEIMLFHIDAPNSETVLEFSPAILVLFLVLTLMFTIVIIKKTPRCSH